MKRRSTALGILATLLIVGAFAAAGLALVRRAASPMAPLLPSREKVGIVPIEGVIGLDVQSKDIIEQLEKFRKNPAVKAIVVRIASPGGSVGPSQEIYDKIREVSKEKKVVASMGDVAASGGLYVACGASRIVANPGTITGSIGVIQFELAEARRQDRAIRPSSRAASSRTSKPDRPSTPSADLQVTTTASSSSRARAGSTREDQAYADGRIFPGARRRLAS
jgi:membrane-bound ClpP family serine protease